MTFSTKRSTRTVAAAAAMAAASTLAACGSSDSTTAADAPSINSSSTSSATSTPAPTTSSSTAAADAAKKAAAQKAAAQKAAADEQAAAAAKAAAEKKAAAERASRSQARQAVPAASVVKYVNWSQVERIPNKTVYVYSANLPKGTSKVTQAGQDGTALVTYRTGKDGQKVVSTKSVDAKVTKNAVRRVITVGTGVKQTPVQQTPVQQTPAVKAAPQQQSQQVSRSTVRRAVTQQAAPQRVQQQQAQPKPQRSAAAPVAANSGMWGRIAQCESTGNWSINTGNGYYGGLQFDIPTWLGAGGGAYAPRADLASKAQQIAIANKVYSQRGLQPWQCGHAA